MKTVLATQYISIPEGVTVEVKSRAVTVKGPRGELKRAFKVCVLTYIIAYVEVIGLWRWLMGPAWQRQGPDAGVWAKLSLMYCK